MILLQISDNLNITRLDQRLVQIFAYCIGTKFLHELMYLGIEYSFKFSQALNLENIKGNFYMSSLLYKKNLCTKKALFKLLFKTNYNISKYDSFLLFKKFYILINTINPLLNMLDFIIQIGARSNKSQYQQIVGMRGSLTTSRDYMSKIPLLHNFEQGLNLTEYLISCYGVRKGLLDTSLQTSESGYLTRRLVEVIQDIILKEHHCGSNNFLIIRKYNTIKGVLCFPNSQLLFNKYFYQFNNIREFYIKTPILCYSGRSVCVVCLGFNCNIKVLKGESLGAIYGESLGEPSTQLTLRTFHTGGILNTTTKANFYFLTRTRNYFLVGINFKFISPIPSKKIIKKIKVNILNKYKIVMYKHFYKNLIISKSKLKIKISNLITNFLLIYKFNFLTLTSMSKYFTRKYLKFDKILINNIILNFYSTNILVKNNLKEWIIILLNNNLNYCIFDYFIFQLRGLDLHGLYKSSSLVNIDIIY